VAGPAGRLIADPAPLALLARAAEHDDMWQACQPGRTLRKPGSRGMIAVQRPVIQVTAEGLLRDTHGVHSGASAKPGNGRIRARGSGANG
jgi:hypothetical protein